MPYKNIDNYGVIGDLHTAALVGIDGSIDWCCLPRFDSPSVFGAILDENKGGAFRIWSTAEGRTKQMYLPDTNVLVTRFLSTDGVGEVVDFMPWHDSSHGAQAIVRIVRCVRGSVPFCADCAPAFDYARQSHELKIDKTSARFASREATLVLRGTVPFERRDNNNARAKFALHENETQTFVLELAGEGGHKTPPDIGAYAEQVFQETIDKWRRWSSRCSYTGRWREMVMRSALALKLLIYEPTGAIVAAPTCGLPEGIGGVRNWDYRYTWIRDAAFTIYGLLELNYFDEAGRFMEWLQNRTAEDQETGPLQVMYRVDGSSDLKEFTLDHLDGFKGSKPVRIGNSASGQLQLDIYGELIDSIYLYNKHVEPISYDFWNYLRKIGDWVCDNWQRPDSSIWEVRRTPEQYTYSKMQCWVALDRLMRIAMKRNLPTDLERLRKESQKIFETVMQKGWNGNSFVRVLGGDSIDATSLLFPLMKFVSPSDARMTATLERVLKELVSDSLVYRYRTHGSATDGLPGAEGTFSACTFWLVEVLSRIGRLHEARLIFEKMLSYSNHLGLYAEEVGPTGEALGNFPQAFTHLGLISAALDLQKNLNLHLHP
ncbi:MAG TPA: glycoside hydrolase family 15 protein [Bryobacteraceae bacterium]|jgi:GH15 family glucan-1,4-alpha-glucosidase